MQTNDALTALRDLPGPRGLPLIGVLHQIRFDRLHLQLEAWADSYGALFRIPMGPRSVAVVSDAAAIQRILVQRPQVFRRTRRLASVAQEMRLKGVFATEGEDWRRQRRIVTAALNRQKLTDFFPKLALTVARLQRRWEGAADRSEPVDVCGDLMRFTVDVTMQLAFSVDANTLETPGPVIQRHLDKVLPVLYRRSNAPFAWWRLFRLPSDRALDRALVAIEREVGEMIRTARQRMAADPGRAPADFLEAMLAAVEEEGSGFCDAEIFANAGNLLLAGEDTTANSIAWAMHYFMLCPEMFERVRDEADALLAPAPALENLEQANCLPILDAFCNEVMRIRPVAPLHVVEPVTDIELLGCAIPKGTPIFMLLRYVATRETHFAGGDRFDPERWFPESQPSPHDRRVFLPFGGGPRLCPGRALALLEIRAALTMLCRNFDLEPVIPASEVHEHMAFTMMPAGLKARLRRRTAD
ncbi:MAG: cytochrome P450 [Alphaproteobacteria bacterium]|nr:cytochrome P450 [Alphaproteobacteria bacterium]